MYYFCRCYILYVFLLECVFVIAWNYNTYYLEYEELCKNGVITLSTTKDSAAIVNKSNDVVRHVEKNQNFHCRFRVHKHVDYSKADDNEKPLGVAAVIQYAYLRRDAETNKCIDYVQIDSHDGSGIPRLCGERIAAVEMDDVSSNRYARNAFVGEYLDIVVHFGGGRVDSENVDLKIVFTAFKACEPFDDRFVSCQTNDDEICMAREFFGDKELNCPFEGCVDENGCAREPRVVRGSDGSASVAIGAIASFVVGFVVFSIALWTCHKFGKLCWAPGFRIPGRARNSHEAVQTEPPPQFEPHARIDGPQLESQPTVTPSAPQSPSDESKDPPPSYSSLFPSDA